MLPLVLKRPFFVVKRHLGIFFLPQSLASYKKGAPIFIDTP